MNCMTLCDRALARSLGSLVRVVMVRANNSHYYNNHHNNNNNKTNSMMRASCIR